MTIREPKNCTPDELAKFMELAIEGGQVSAEGLQNRIRNCKYLGFHYEGDELVAISAVKQKDVQRVKRTQAKAGIEEINPPLLELGYSYTRKNFRKRGLNRIVKDTLLERVKGERIYATTDNDKIQDM